MLSIQPQRGTKNTRGSQCSLRSLITRSVPHLRYVYTAYTTLLAASIVYCTKRQMMLCPFYVDEDFPRSDDDDDDDSPRSDDDVSCDVFSCDGSETTTIIASVVVVIVRRK
jgi:hypothetical protein